MEMYYREVAEKEGRRVCVVRFDLFEKEPEVLELGFKDMAEKVWREYLEKQIVITFMAHFWGKFLQIYFDEDHDTWTGQVVRAFNIAKLESWVIVKKKWLEGLSGSEV